MEDNLTREGANKLLEIVKANSPYTDKANFRVQADVGGYVIRSDLFRGLPKPNGKEIKHEGEGDDDTRC